MTHKEIFDQFEESFTKTWNEYAELHKKLDAYRGVEIGERVEEINQLLHEIQEKFAELYPSVNFIIQRYQLCAKGITDYNEFVEDIKKAGGVAVDAKA